jgi:hypothetical protein
MWTVSSSSGWVKWWAEVKTRFHSGEVTCHVPLGHDIEMRSGRRASTFGCTYHISRRQTCRWRQWVPRKRDNKQSRSKNCSEFLDSLGDYQFLNRAEWESLRHISVTRIKLLIPWQFNDDHDYNIYDVAKVDQLQKNTSAKVNRLGASFDLPTNRFPVTTFQSHCRRYIHFFHSGLITCYFICVFVTSQLQHYSCQ